MDKQPQDKENLESLRPTLIGLGIFAGVVLSAAQLFMPAELTPIGFLTDSFSGAGKWLDAARGEVPAQAASAPASAPVPAGR